MTAIGTKSYNVLPDVVQVKIGEFLNPNDCVASTSVSKGFKKVMENPHLWKRISELNALIIRLIPYKDDKQALKKITDPKAQMAAIEKLKLSGFNPLAKVQVRLAEEINSGNKTHKFVLIHLLRMGVWPNEYNTQSMALNLIDETHVLYGTFDDVDIFKARLEGIKKRDKTGGLLSQALSWSMSNSKLIACALRAGAIPTVEHLTKAIFNIAQAKPKKRSHNEQVYAAILNFYESNEKRHKLVHEVLESAKKEVDSYKDFPMDDSVKWMTDRSIESNIREQLSKGWS